jgi:hypothetical protein
VKIHVWREPFGLGVNVTFFEVDGEYVTTYSVNKDGQLVALRKKYEAVVSSDEKPTFQLREDIFRKMLKGFVDLARDEGVKPTNESRVEGLLEGTERHLGDLRKILKLDKEPK